VLKLSSALLITLFSVYSYASPLKEVNYDGFTLWMNCTEKLAVLAKYQVSKDTANYQKKSYKMGKNEGCRQSSSSTYASAAKKLPPEVRPEHPYHNGHIVPANHLDYSQESINDSMHMDNIFPQVGRFNGSGGSWFYTEKLTECLRDGTDLDVYLGLIMGANDKNDHFTSSHGVKTPDLTWKIIHRKDTNTIQTYLMPNTYESTESNMAEYVVDIEILLSKLSNDEVKAYLMPLVSLDQGLKPWIVSGSRDLVCGEYSASSS
jgi:endonuclease G